MKKHERELYSAIAKAEQMSGYNGEGYMSAFDDMDGFDGDEFNSFDDSSSYADGGSNRHVAMSDPYVIQYEETSGGNVVGTLFGYNDNFNATNFGNPVTTNITNLQGGTYGRMIAQSNNKNFKIGKFRFQSSTASQLTQTYSLVHVDANGKQYSTPLNLSILKDAYQFQNDIIDVEKIISVDGNTSITFTLIANAILVISMFPVAVLSGKSVLNGGMFDNTAKAPRLSGKNVAPVIIQTSQGVKGITQ